MKRGSSSRWNVSLGSVPAKRLKKNCTMENTISMKLRGSTLVDAWIRGRALFRGTFLEKGGIIGVSFSKMCGSMGTN